MRNSFIAALLLLFTPAVLGLAFQGTTILAIDGGAPNILYSITSDNPDSPLTTSRLKGMYEDANEQLLAIAQQRTTGLIWGLSNLNSLYQVDPLTSNCYYIGPVSGCNPIYSNPTLHMSFDPSSGLLDVVTLLDEGDNHFSVDVDTGKCQTSGRIQSLNSASPVQPAGAAWDTRGNKLYIIDSTPNNQLSILNRTTNQLSLVGDLGITVSGVGGFDVVYDSTTQQAYGFAALFTLQQNVERSDLYGINLATGLAEKVANLSFATNLLSFAAVDPASIKTTPYTFTVGDSKTHFAGKSSTSLSSLSSSSETPSSEQDQVTSSSSVPVQTPSTSVPNSSSSAFGTKKVWIFLGLLLALL